jgi:hypothetical protein
MAYNSSNIQKEVAGVELAERAKQIASQKRITFGEALFQARREMADTVTVPSTVRPTTASPLRQEEPAKTPAASEVRTAVISGLNTVAPTWRKGDATWIATSGAYAIRQGCAAVAENLDALGIGDQLISGISSDLQAFLNNAVLQQGYNGLLSDLVTQAGDHVAAVYQQALANKVATQGLSESQIAYAVRMSDESHSAVSLDSVVLRDEALAVSKSRGVSFGEALRIVRRSFASEVVEPDAVKQAVHQALRGKLDGMLQGKKTVVNRFDVKQAHAAAMAAVQKLNTSGYGEVSDAVEGSLNNLFSGDQQEAAIDPADLESIAAKAGSSAAAAYSKHLNSVN